MKKVLIITPRSPFQGRGADEQDRLAGVEWFVKNSFEVRVITKTLPSDLPSIEEAKKRLGIAIFPVSYKNKRGLKRYLLPTHWDGAAHEYFDPEIQKLVQDQVGSWGPDVVWFDYTYLWPLYDIVRAKHIPIITRSINFEPEHFLDEDGRNFVNRLRAWPKYQSEQRALRGSDWLFAITPKEEEIYKRLGKTPVRTLPLRALPDRLIERKVAAHEGVRIGFMPSTYNVHHNKEALRFIIEDVWPALTREIKQKASIHVTGNKFPKDVIIPEGVTYEGFVPSSIEFWQSMDIALSPSLFGAGMQQKIFEPIALGVPTITSARGLVGYPFVCGRDLVCAETKDEVVAALLALVDNPARRQEISASAQALSRQLFAREKYAERLKEVLVRCAEIQAHT